MPLLVADGRSDTPRRSTYRPTPWLEICARRMNRRCPVQLVEGERACRHLHTACAFVLFVHGCHRQVETILCPVQGQQPPQAKSCRCSSKCQREKSYSMDLAGLWWMATAWSQQAARRLHSASHFNGQKSQHRRVRRRQRSCLPSGVRPKGLEQLVASHLRRLIFYFFELPDRPRLADSAGIRLQRRRSLQRIPSIDSR